MDIIFIVVVVIIIIQATEAAHGGPSTRQLLFSFAKLHCCWAHHLSSPPSLPPCSSCWPLHVTTSGWDYDSLQSLVKSAKLPQPAMIVDLDIFDSNIRSSFSWLLGRCSSLAFLTTMVVITICVGGTVRLREITARPSDWPRSQ